MQKLHHAENPAHHPTCTYSATWHLGSDPSSPNRISPSNTTALQVVHAWRACLTCFPKILLLQIGNKLDKSHKMANVTSEPSYQYLNCMLYCAKASGGPHSSRSSSLCIAVGRSHSVPMHVAHTSSFSVSAFIPRDLCVAVCRSSASPVLRFSHSKACVAKQTVGLPFVPLIRENYADPRHNQLQCAFQRLSCGWPLRDGM